MKRRGRAGSLERSLQDRKLRKERIATGGRERDEKRIQRRESASEANYRGEGGRGMAEGKRAYLRLSRGVSKELVEKSLRQSEQTKKKEGKERNGERKRSRGKSGHHSRGNPGRRRGKDGKI